MCVPIADNMDDEKLFDGDLKKRGYADNVRDSLVLWRQCLRTPCGGGGIDSERDRDDVKLRYGYDDNENEGSAFVAVGQWPRRRRRGQCVTMVTDDDNDDDNNDDSPSTMVWPSVVKNCLPNDFGGNDKQSSSYHRRHRGGKACGRLRVTLDPTRLQRGTRVSAVCHSLRRLLARAWIRNEDQDLGDEFKSEVGRNRVYVMCEAAVADYQRDDEERSGSNSRRRRRRRHVIIHVSVVRIHFVTYNKTLH